MLQILRRWFGRLCSRLFDRSPGSLPSHLWRLLLTGLVTLPAIATTPLVSTYKPAVDAYPHYYSITQAADRRIYIGGENEVLRFDGTRWSRIAVPGPIHSIASDGDRIWVGAFNAFGYITRQADGSETFVDISASFADRLGARAIGEMWGLVVRPEGIYFRALRDLFLVDRDGKPKDYWFHAGRFGVLQAWNDQLYLQWRGIGMKRLNGRTFETIAGTEKAGEGLILAMYALDAEHALLQFSDSRFRLWGPRGIEPFVPAVDAGARQASYRRGLPLADGNLLLPSADGKLGLLDPRTRRLRTMELGSSFLSNVLLDRDNSLWVLGLNQISRINWPASWMQYGERDGVVGGIYRFKRIGGWLYAMTVDGMLRAPASGDDARFVRAPWGTDSAWDIVEDGDALLVATQFHLRILQGGVMRPVGPNDLYPRMIVPSRHSQDRMWIATAWGIASIERSRGKGGGSWQLTSQVNDLQNEVFDLIESDTDPRELWLALHSRGIVRLTMSADFKRIERRTAPDLPAPPQSTERRLSRLGNALIASAPGNLAAWDGTRFSVDALPPSLKGLLPLLGPDETVSLKTAPDGTQWAQTFRSIFRSTPQGVWRKEEVSAFAQGPFVDLSLGNAGDVLVASTAAIFRRAGDAPPSASTAPRLDLQRITVSRPGHDPSPLPLDTPAVVGPGHVNVQFDLSLSDFTHAAHPRFQTRLIGFDEDWGQWRDDAQASYPRLPPGRYRFEARALDSLGRQHDIPAFDLVVQPHWYENRSIWVVVMVLAAAGLAYSVVLVARWRTRRLDALVKSRTLALEEANLRLQNLASRDGLTGVYNRRKFDQVLQAALQDGIERGRPVAMLLIDVDHFKEYNDRHGHLAGDEVLKAAGQLLSSYNDAADSYAARYGGEEFVVLLCGVSAESAMLVADTIRTRIKALPHGVSVSIGVAAADPTRRESGVELIARADGALYLAKNGGRDRSVLAG